MFDPSDSQEKLIIQGVYQGEDKFDNDPETQIILDVINKDKKANLFNEVAKYYRDNKNIFLFTTMLRNKEQLEKILNVISGKCGVEIKEQFVGGMNVFLDGISAGERDAREFLHEEFSHSDLVALFNGPQAACKDQVRNIHRSLNINIIKLGKALETSSFFSRKTKRMEEEKSEVKRAVIYINGKGVVTIEKNEKQQRNYSFKKSAICDMEISWGAKDGSGKNLNCVVVLNVNSGQISIKKSTIDGKDVEPKGILELAKQDKAVLIGNKALHEVLGECLTQVSCEEKENTQSREDVVVPGSSFDEGVTIEGGAPAPQKETAVNNGRSTTH